MEVFKITITSASSLCIFLQNFSYAPRNISLALPFSCSHDPWGAAETVDGVPHMILVMILARLFLSTVCNC